jgi:hypothetical protein
MVIIVQDDNLPCFRIMANVKQYLANKLSRVIVSVV